MSDLLPGELLVEAQKAIDASPPGSYVHFKYTCEQCGERCVLAEPNMLRERGVCHVCGHETTIATGGFMLIMKVESVDPIAEQAKWN